MTTPLKLSGVMRVIPLVDGEAAITDHDQLVIAVANKFTTLLREELGAETFGEVRRRNRADADLAVCHSHDFCDANMLMHDAIVTVISKRRDYAGQPLYEADLHDDLWNDAWSLARRQHLS